jgi:hypothetical protein
MSMGAIIYRAASVRKHCDIRTVLADEFTMCENSRSEETTCHPHNQFLDSRRPSVFLKF